MTLRFVHRRSPHHASELTAEQQRQVELAWRSYAGEEASAEALIGENAGWFELYAVERDGVHAFDYWHLPPDNGTLFHAGESVPTGICVVQFSWDVSAPDARTRAVPQRRALLRELSEAWQVAGGIAGDVDEDTFPE